MPHATHPARTALTMLGLAALAAIAACGSSTPSPSTPTPTTTPTASPATAAAPAPCGQAHFGGALAPEDPPADVHHYTAAPAMQIDTTKLYEVTLSTARGAIVLCLQPSLAPRTVNNFVALTRNHFYDGLTFHRVVAGFVIQGGDPKGDGSGGPGYRFADEPVTGTYTTGCVAMANAGPNTNGSQFFICTADDTSLPPQYNLFGRVQGGLDVALRIQQGDVITSAVVTEQQ